MDLLELHQSFWDRRKGFYRWQLLRRKTEYREAEVFKIRDSEVFTNSLYSRFYQNYPPEPKDTFGQWAWRVIHFGPKTKILAGKEKEAILSPRFAPETLRLPARWKPVPPEIDFPHPYALELLTDSLIGVAVTTVIFPDMREIQIDGKHFWGDLSFSFGEICSDIFGYLELQGWRSWSGGRENLVGEEVRERRRIARAVKIQLESSLRHRKRNSAPERSRKNGSAGNAPRLARALRAWDMNQSGKTYRKIAETLSPNQSSSAKNRIRAAAIDRAKKDVRYAKHLIKVSFSR